MKVKLVYADRGHSQGVNKSLVILMWCQTCSSFLLPQFHTHPSFPRRTSQSEEGTCTCIKQPSSSGRLHAAEGASYQLHARRKVNTYAPLATLVAQQDRWEKDVNMEASQSQAHVRPTEQTHHLAQRGQRNLEEVTPSATETQSPTKAPAPQHYDADNSARPPRQAPSSTTAETPSRSPTTSSQTPA